MESMIQAESLPSHHAEVARKQSWLTLPKDPFHSRMKAGQMQKHLRPSCLPSRQFVRSYELLLELEVLPPGFVLTTKAEAETRNFAY